MSKKSIIYARVSTNRQAKDELPIDSQVDSCRAKAKSLNLTIDKIFKDEGYTASNDRRPAFQDAIIYCDVFDIDYLITWSSSRFARNKRDASYYKDRLDSCGTKIIYVSMDIDISTTPGWMIDGFMELADEYYSRQTSDDTKRSMIRNARSGYWNGGNPPYGFQPVSAPDNPKRKVLIPAPEEVDIVNRIFRMKADQGMGIRSIIKIFNENGVLNRGREWKLSTLGDLLKNQALIGKTVFGKTSRGKKRTKKPMDQWIIVDSHPAIVDQELFDQVQDILKNETPTYTGDCAHHLLAGMVRCSECNAKMYIESASGRSKKYYYYYCRSAKLNNSHTYIRYRADVIDDHVIEAVNQQVFDTEVLSHLVTELKKIKSTWNIEADRQIDICKKQIDALELRNKNLMDVLQQLGVNAENLSAITDALKDNTISINDQKIKIRELENNDIDSIDLNVDVSELCRLIGELLGNRESLAEIRGFLQTFIDEVNIGIDEIKINYEPFQAFKTVRNPCGWLPGPRAVGTVAAVKTIVIEMPRAANRRKTA